MVYGCQVNWEWVNALLEPKWLNPRKTMISLLTRPRYKLNKVLSDHIVYA